MDGFVHVIGNFSPSGSMYRHANRYPHRFYESYTTLGLERNVRHVICDEANG
jgi:hypothetical protein